MAKEQGSGEFIAGFVFGAFVGAVLALLFAPAPGDEIRTQIREKGIELKDRAETMGVGAGKAVDGMRAKGEVFVRGQKSRFQEAIEEGKKAASRRKEELLAQLEEAQSGDQPAAPTEQEA